MRRSRAATTNPSSHRPPGPAFFASCSITEWVSTKPGGTFEDCEDRLERLRVRAQVLWGRNRLPHQASRNTAAPMVMISATKL